MNTEEVLLTIIIGAAAWMLYSSKCKRKCWVKDWINRKNKGNLHLINKELNNHPESFRNFLRMDKTTFDVLLNLIEKDITKCTTKFRDPISARDRLIITLRFLASGESYKRLHYSFRVGHATISKIVPEVCQVIYNNLKNDYMKIPSTSAEWQNIAEDFFIKWNLPNIIGAMDGKHIVMHAPHKEGSAYFNYKGQHSIVLLALVDANYRFLYVDAGTNGRISDGGVYRRSKLAEAVEKNKLNLPLDAPLPGRIKDVPYVIVADAAFPLSEHILKPFPIRGMSEAERIFNYRLSRARNVVENAFGILANRFRILLTTINLEPAKVELITLTCTVLHNFLRARNLDEAEVDRRYTFKYGLSKQFIGNRTRTSNLENRQEFVEYVNGNGAVPWQKNCI